MINNDIISKENRELENFLQLGINKLGRKPFTKEDIERNIKENLNSAVLHKMKEY